MLKYSQLNSDNNGHCHALPCIGELMNLLFFQEKFLPEESRQVPTGFAEQFKIN
jgi:hypothetical protein